MLQHQKGKCTSFEPLTFSFALLLSQHCCGNLLQPRKALCVCCVSVQCVFAYVCTRVCVSALTSKHKWLQQLIKFWESRLANYGNANCCIIGPCVLDVYYKSHLLLLIKSSINSWCVCVQCPKSNSFSWHHLGILHMWWKKKKKVGWGRRAGGGFYTWQ